MYLHYLRIIDKKSEQIEEKLHLSTRNQELMELLELEKSLVYFTTSLRSNEMVLEKHSEGGEYQEISGGYRASGGCYH